MTDWEFDSQLNPNDPDQMVKLWKEFNRRYTATIQRLLRELGEVWTGEPVEKSLEQIEVVKRRALVNPDIGEVHWRLFLWNGSFIYQADIPLLSSDADGIGFMEDDVNDKFATINIIININLKFFELSIIDYGGNVVNSSELSGERVSLPYMKPRLHGKEGRFTGLRFPTFEELQRAIDQLKQSLTNQDS